MAEQCNRDGNRALLGEKDFLSAVKSHTQGLEICDAANDEIRSVLFSNRSVAYDHLERWQDAMDDANSCRDVRPGWYRLHACRCAALEGFGRPSRSGEALDAFRTALQIDPANVELKSIVEELERLEKVQVPQSSLTGEGEATSGMHTANGAPLSRACIWQTGRSQGGEPHAGHHAQHHIFLPTLTLPAHTDPHIACGLWLQTAVTQEISSLTGPSGNRSM